MIKTISFFAFFFASFAGLAAVALFLLLHKMKSGQIQKNRPLLLLVLTTAILGIFYISEFYYFHRNADGSGWTGYERAADILLYMLMAFFWFRFQRCELQLDQNCLLGRFTDGIIIAFAFIMMLVYGLMMDEHYYVDSLWGRTFASVCETLLILSMLTLACIYGRLTILHMGVEKKRTYILSINIIQFFNGAWNGLFVLQMINRIPVADGLLKFQDYDFTAVMLLIMNALITLYIYQTRFLPNAAREQERDPQQLERELATYHLTERERQVAKLLLQGNSYDQIAEELFISKYTVKRHAHNLYQKTGVSAKVDLIKKFQ